MLDELTVRHPRTALSQIVQPLIRIEFERALHLFPSIFKADPDGYERFISILSTAYRHQVPIAPLRKFAGDHFGELRFPDRVKEFREAAKDRNYDHLTDRVVAAAFLDMAYAYRADRDFRLPVNYYDAIMSECANIPLLHKPRHDSYHDQNYYATHVILALNHYGQRSLQPTGAGDRILFYLMGQYDTVRHRVDDLDLLCEYLYCLKQFNLKRTEFVLEGEEYILSRQKKDGSWGEFDPDDDPYDRLHPTWTAITLLVRE